MNYGTSHKPHDNPTDIVGGNDGRWPELAQQLLVSSDYAQIGEITKKWEHREIKCWMQTETKL
jgi:hypothetical protein